MPALNTLADGNSPKHVLIFGPPMSGKTQLISQLAYHYKLVYFDIDGTSVDTLLKLAPEAQANVTVISIMDTVDEPRAIATVDKVVKGGDFNLCDTHGTVSCPWCIQKGNPFTSIHVRTGIADAQVGLDTIYVFDSFSQLTISCNSAVNKLLGRVTTPDFIPERAKNWGDEWDGQGKMLNRVLGAIKVAPYHCIVTAHEIESEREDGGKRIVPSIGTVNYAMTCGKSFGHIIYMDKVNCKHEAYSDTSYSNKVLTGSRLDIALEGMNGELSLLPIFQGERGVGKNNIKGRASAVLSDVSSTIGMHSSTQAPAATPGANLLNRFAK